MKTRTTTWPAGLLTAFVLGAALPAAAQTTTTSTTMPPSTCVEDASLTSITCRSDALAARLDAAADLGRTGSGLKRHAAKLERLLVEAEAAGAASDLRRMKTKLKRAGRVLETMDFRLRSLKGRRNVAEATRNELRAVIDRLDADLKALRAAR